MPPTLNIVACQAIVNFKSRALGGLGKPHSRTRVRAATHRIRRSFAAVKSVVLFPAQALGRRIRGNNI